MSQQDGERIAEFSRLLTEHRNRVFCFIYSMLHNLADAEDVYQQTTIVLWEKYSDFEPGTSFLNWALAIAQNKVMQFRRSKGKEKLLFDDSVVSQMADEYASLGVAQPPFERLDGLLNCLGKLSDKQRRVLRLRYAESLPIRELAKRERKSESAMVMVLARLRKTLMACISLAIARGQADG